MPIKLPAAKKTAPDQAQPKRKAVQEPRNRHKLTRPGVKGSKRLSVLLYPDEAKALQELRDELGLPSLAEVIARALLYWHEARKKGGQPST